MPLPLRTRENFQRAQKTRREREKTEKKIGTIVETLIKEGDNDLLAQLGLARSENQPLWGTVERRKKTKTGT